MVLVVKRVKSSRPSLIHQRNPDSSTTMRTDGGKSESSQSLKSNSSQGHSSSSKCRVCFALDYDTPSEVIPSNIALTDEEALASFYSRDDLKRFDKDRALTIIMYRARKANGGAAWDDNLYSVRGLEESLVTCKKDDKSRLAKREEFVKAVLGEQDRLRNTESGRDELTHAAKAIKKERQELATELLRGVSCSLSKIDKQRAIGMALKDEKASGCYRGSAHRLLAKMSGKIATWINTSSKSINSSSDPEDARP